jgi:excisionase family DNA binding protein
MPWITVEEMRRTLKIGKNKALALLASGAIEGIRVGRAVRVSQDSLDRYIAANPYKPDDGREK